MNRLPPRWLRRLVLAPLGVLVGLAWLAIAPALLAIAALHRLVDRRGRLLRLVAFSAVYAFYEVVSLLVLFGLWLAAGAGYRLDRPRMQERHFAYMRWWLQRIYRAAERLFRLEIRIEDRPEPRPGPVLVFSRHAGPGNSLMLVGTLMIAYRRRPRIVMLAKLQWDPYFDVIGNRLPNRFITHRRDRRDRSLEVIAELAGGTCRESAFVLFPEGRDFTDKLRERAIASLRRKGHERWADRAERMRRVLPPRHGGVLAAVTAAPEADVVFVAHTALEDIGHLSELWHRIPLERPITARYWRVPAAEVPRERDALIEWLFNWWTRIDDWIAARTEDQPAYQPASR